MSFLETPRFPLKASYGAVGGPDFATDVVEVNSGSEQRNVRWDQARATYTIEMPLIEANKETLLAWFRAVRGRAHGFRLRDWADYQVTSTTGRLGTSTVGTGVQVYQLYKFYDSGGALYQYRKISKPAGTPAIYRGGVLQTVGASAGNYALDTTTGVLTWVADASSSATSITPGSTTTVILTTNPGTLIAGKLLYLTGFAGTDAALVNGLAHTINSVSGTGPFTFVLATVTTGKTITLGSGLGRKFAQASETLYWIGTFDVPVRFDTDYGGLNIEAPGVYRGPFVLKELRI